MKESHKYNSNDYARNTTPETSFATIKSKTLVTFYNVVKKYGHEKYPT